MINWKIKSEHDERTLAKISGRVRSLLPNAPLMTIEMDIRACHLNGNPLDLDRLLEAPAFDFVHDVCGINRHIDRKTGQLKDCFVPRFSLS